MTIDDEFLFIFFCFSRQTRWIDSFERVERISPLENPLTGPPAVRYPPLIALSYKEQAAITVKNANFMDRKCRDEVNERSKVPKPV